MQKSAEALKIRKIIRRIILAFTFVLSIIFLLTHYGKNEYTRENLEAYVHEMCGLYNVPALSATIIDGKNEYFINYGTDNGKAVDETSRFELGSTTKAFTGLALMQLEKDGKLSLEDSVSDYLPWFKPTYKKSPCDITIENLMCHTSGIPAWTISTIPTATNHDEDFLTKTIQNIENVDLSSEPGTHYEYATINFDVLALILEKITGEKFEDYVTSHILEPLDMRSSFFRTNNDYKEEMVQGYKIMFMGAHKYKAPSYYGNIAAGYLTTSTADLMKWLKVWGFNSQDDSGLVKAVLNHDVSKSDTYFAGWHICDDFIEHGGNNPNFCSQVIISRKKNQSVFVLSNLAGSSAAMIADGIYRILLGERLKTGLQIDYNALSDILSIDFILLLIYFVLLCWDKKSKKACIIRMSFSVIFFLAALIFPFVFHYPHTVISVWQPFTLIIALIAATFVAVFDFYRAVKGLRRILWNSKI